MTTETDCRCGECAECEALLDMIEHPMGCIRGGFGCEYWLTVPGCQLPHPQVHVHAEGERCPLQEPG